MGKNKDEIKNILSSDVRVVNDWFYEKFMALNPEKNYFMSLGKDIDDTETLSFNDFASKNSKEVKILGITLDRNLDFNTHAKNICRKAGQKLRALLRISPYLVQGKKGLLYKSMKKSQFNYCLLVWMYCSRQSNNLMNRVHERGLRLTYRNGIAPPIMSSLFNFRANIHNIRNFLDIFTENRKTVKYCIETATYQAPFL